MKIRLLIVALGGVLLVGACAFNPLSLPLGDASGGVYKVDGVTQEFPVPLFLTNVPHTPWQVQFTESQSADSTALTTYLNRLTDEMNKYPKAYLDTVGLRGLAVVKNLVVTGQARSAMPDLVRHIVFLDFTRGADNETYQRHVMHHEFYHLIEQDINGDAFWKDPNWAALNPPGFQYGNGGASDQNNGNAYYFTHPQTGFINQYSTSALEEDKAEVYAALFVDGEYQTMMNLAKTDTVLANKIQYLKNFIHQQNAEMDDAFWARLHPVP